MVTLHRPSNVDSAATLGPILAGLAALAEEIPVVFPVHPRTRERIQQFGLSSYVSEADQSPNTAVPGRIALLNPLGYLDFFRLMSEARLVLTDSGGIQDETTCVGVPCLTLRENTERPVTVTQGTSTLVGNDPEDILAHARRALRNGLPSPQLPPLWDGHAAERIVKVLLEKLA